MAMRLLKRLVVLLKADAHGVVDSLEDRRLLLKQCLREAEIDLNGKRARLEGLQDEVRRLQEALTQCEGEVQALDDDISLALAGEKDDLARFAIRRLIPRREALNALHAQIEQGTTEQEQLAAQVETQQAQFERLRGRVRAALAKPDVDLDMTVPRLCEEAVRDEEVELELLRRRQAQGGVA